MEQKDLASLLLRLGIAFSFFYVAISSFLNPTAWIGFLPGFVRSEGILIVFSIFEILLGLLLVFGKKVFYAAIFSAISMLGIIVFNFGALDIIFRDVTILLASIALAIMHYKEVDRKVKIM